MKQKDVTHNLWVANGFVIELVEQEGDDMRSIHRMLSYILGDFFDASFFKEVLRTSAVENLCDSTTVLFSKSDLKPI